MFRAKMGISHCHDQGFFAGTGYPSIYHAMAEKQQNRTTQNLLSKGLACISRSHSIPQEIGQVVGTLYFEPVIRRAQQKF